MNTESSGRWAIDIDIEGFGAFYSRDLEIMSALRQLMEGIFNIGNFCYPDLSEALFAHQIGDGFIIVSNFPEDTLHRPVAIALALLRHVASSGRFAKAATAEGGIKDSVFEDIGFADIRGCYPALGLRNVIARTNDKVAEEADEFERVNKRVKENSRGSLTYSLGDGLMTLFPVMGTALIRAVGVAKTCPSGPLLAVSKEDRVRLPDGLRLHEVTEGDLIVIDWINSENELACSIASSAGLNSPTREDLHNMLKAYCQQQPVPPKWKENVQLFLGVPVT